MMNCNLTDLNALIGASIQVRFKRWFRVETIIGDVSYRGFTFK